MAIFLFGSANAQKLEKATGVFIATLYRAAKKRFDCSVVEYNQIALTADSKEALLKFTMDHVSSTL